MKKVIFTKMSGAGNDFILFEDNIDLNENLIKKLCHRRNGIGADGVITISSSEKYDFDMKYYNADGSTGSLCGNGARCAIKYAEKTGRIKNGKTTFLSNGELYSGEIVNYEKIKFFLNLPQKLKLNFEIKAGGQSINASFIDTGSPHVVINIADLKQENGNIYSNIDLVPVYNLGKEIRYLKDFSPQGTNVNFIKPDKGLVLIRTYERGVEDETLACGTGAVAAAVISSLNYGLNPPVKLITYGQDELVVDFQVIGENVKNISLTGPARVIFTGEILI